eukprot:Hpha_TRINITY_DN15325_c1_g11::TRINITY_DN15325_c1_g11_i2::g.87819::m.87819
MKPVAVSTLVTPEEWLALAPKENDGKDETLSLIIAASAVVLSICLIAFMICLTIMWVNDGECPVLGRLFGTSEEQAAEEGDAEVPVNVLTPEKTEAHEVVDSALAGVIVVPTEALEFTAPCCICLEGGPASGTPQRRSPTVSEASQQQNTTILQVSDVIASGLSPKHQTDEELGEVEKGEEKDDEERAKEKMEEMEASERLPYGGPQEECVLWTKLPCATRHPMHSVCLRRWLSSQVVQKLGMTCPGCRAPILRDGSPNEPY